MPETTSTTTDRTVPRLLGEFEIEIDQVQDYEFRVRLDKPHYPELMVDAPAPVGRDMVPSPSRLLAAAMGHCLASGLLFCARKAGVPLGPIRATVRTQLVRNERGHPRIGKVEVEIDPHVSEAVREEAARCVEVFEDLCMVTQSVREGVEVSVRVKGVPTAG
jgi:organic hydroperoxide reductase OsmC/OhrA